MKERKMKTTKIALATLFSLCVAGSALADSYKNDSGYYAELGYTPLSLGDSTATVKPKLARFGVGKNVHENLAVEAMYATTVSKDTYQGADVTSSGYGLFLKPKMEIAKNTELFGRLGWFKTNLKVSASGLSAADSGSDFSYGLGVQTKLTDTLYGQVDYMNFYHKDGITSKALSFSIGARF
ncbi:porin family protein [Limnohabitans sp. TEGF004]|jgi:hypothetical protein|uniref:porin family protein n=1 Tax=Limnohabitans sp. TEGF004 TaxID=2986281 RepID=UPI00248F63FB|nr:porin family protein [Limnohabitans sp. TEGF004]